MRSANERWASVIERCERDGAYLIIPGQIDTKNTTTPPLDTEMNDGVHRFRTMNSQRMPRMLHYWTSEWSWAVVLKTHVCCMSFTDHELPRCSVNVLTSSHN